MDCNGILHQKINVEQFYAESLEIEMKGIGLKHQCEKRIFSISISFSGKVIDQKVYELEKIENGYFNSPDLFHTCHFSCERDNGKNVKYVSLFHNENLNFNYTKDIYLFIKE